ncbi:MAG: TetR/AcrR family transcriptional regulator [Alphaproteobacteria bacterium]|nr:TetR/AcrR family transcriptional regulator [Alphaproteobacteria bacterium]
MGRKLEFCRDKALHTAMESFWAHGYESTSMRDLAQRLGLHLGSVYNALGDKEKVFEAALRLNFQEHMQPRLKALAEDPNPLQALDRHLSHIVEECSKPEAGPGCFITNSLLEITHINDSITALLNDYMTQWQEAYAACIENAKRLGQVPQTTDAQKYSHMLLASALSMRAFAKLKIPMQSIDDIRACTLKALATNTDNIKASAA